MVPTWRRREALGRRCKRKPAVSHRESGSRARRADCLPDELGVCRKTWPTTQLTSIMYLLRAQKYAACIATVNALSFTWFLFDLWLLKFCTSILNC